MTDKQE